MRPSTRPPNPSQQKRASRPDHDEDDEAPRGQEPKAEDTDEEETPGRTEFGMELASTIASQYVAGYSIATPIVVLLSRRTKASPSLDDIWVFLSLVDASLDISSRDDLLHGQRSDNAHPILGYINASEDNFAYASFHNIHISTPGRYRFRVFAIDMKRHVICTPVYPPLTDL